MTFWAIQEVGTNKFMPASKGAGHTGDEPEECTAPCIPPRLFTTEGAAKCAITWWKKGISFKKRSGGYDTFSGEYDYEEWIETDDSVDRSGRELVPVPMSLTIDSDPQRIRNIQAP